MVGRNAHHAKIFSLAYPVLTRPAGAFDDLA
jgi:hypothetical protein